MGCINSEPNNKISFDTRRETLQLRKTLIKSRNHHISSNHNGMENPNTNQRTGDSTNQLNDYSKEIDLNRFKRLYEEERQRNDLLLKEIELLKSTTERLKNSEEEYERAMQEMKQFELDYKEALAKLSAPVRLSPKLIKDEYDYCRDLFCCLNDVRFSPSAMIEHIDNILNSVTLDDDVAFINLTEHRQFSSLGTGNYQLNCGVKGLKELRELAENYNKSSFEPIIWSERAFVECMAELEDLNHLDIDYSDSEEDEQTMVYSSQVVSKLEGSFFPMIALVLLLAEEQPSVRNSILSDQFEIGACSYIRNDEEFPRGMTLMMLSIRKDLETRMLNYPVIAVGEDLQLSNPVFRYLDYKSQITDGDFEIENGVLIARFLLKDGGKRTERIVLS